MKYDLQYFIRNKVKFLQQGFNEIIEGFQKFSIVFYFAWGDTRARYRRSILGPFWIVLSTAVSVAGLGFLWSILLKEDASRLVPSLTIGLIIWQFISGCILEASSTFIRNAHFIRNMLVPYFIFPMHLIMRQVINLVHNLLVAIVVFMFFPPHLGFAQWLIVPGILLVLGNLCWIVLLLAIFGARFRDIEQIIGAAMPLFFFLSPIIYRSDQLGSYENIAWLNPFSYLLSLIRDPIIGITPPAFVYELALGSILIGGIVTLYQFGKRRGQIAFWV